MAISSYAELKTAVAAWGKRSDLTALIPDFITLAESRIARSLLARTQGQEDELTTVAGSRYVDLPDGFDAPIALWLKAHLPREPLPQVLASAQPGDNSSGYPEWWAIDGTRIAFDKPASQAWAFDFRYKKSFTLSDAEPTNYILTTYPDVYLFGALTELCAYTLDGQQGAVWDARFQAAISAAESAENENRSGARLMTEFTAMERQGRFNINRGY